MQSLFLLLIAAFAAFACGPSDAPSSLNDTHVENYSDELGMRPGIGLDIIQHDVRGECIEFDGVETTGNGQEAVFDFRIIESHRDLFGSMGVASSMQIRAAATTAAGSAAHRAQFALADGLAVSKYSLYLLVSARIRNATSFIKRPRITTAAVNLLKTSDPASLEKFRRQCGDSYMVGSTSGAEFYALFEIETSSDEEMRKLKNVYQGSISGFNRDKSEGQLSTHVSQLRRHHNLQIRTYQRGGSGEAEIGFAQSADEVVSRLKSLADAARLGNNPRPLTATFSDYQTLGLNIPSAHSQKLRDAQLVIEQLATILNGLADLKANMNHILAHQSQFTGLNATKLAEISQTLAQIDNKAELVRTAANRCKGGLGACTLPSGIDLPAVELPQRRRNLAQLESERLVVNTKLYSLDVYGIGDTFSQPECFMKLNIGRHGDDHFITVLRTETYYGPDRCRNLQTQIEIPAALVRDAFAQLGIQPEQGWVELQLFEDDAFYADFLGSTYISFANLDSGAQMKGIHTEHINLQVSFELQD